MTSDPRSAGTRSPAARTVLVCDDQQAMRDAIKKVFSDATSYVVVGEAVDGPSCLAMIGELQPQILILDYSMPGGGPHIARAARKLRPGMHIVVFSGRDDPHVAREMLAAGADQYVLKTGRLRPLLNALETL